MARGRTLAALLAISILANAFCVPVSPKLRQDSHDKNVNSKEKSTTTSTTPDPFDDDDDDFGDSMETASSSGGGSNLFSLLNLASALFPASSGSNIFLRRIVRNFIRRNQFDIFARRGDLHENTIDVDYPDFKPPPLAKQELEDSEESSERGSESGQVSESKGSISEELKPISNSFENVNLNGNKPSHDSKSKSDSDAESTSEEDSSSEGDSELKPNSKPKDDSGSKQDISKDKDVDHAAQDQDDNNKNDDSSGEESDESDEDENQGGLLGLLAQLSGGEPEFGTILSVSAVIFAKLSGAEDFNFNNVIGTVVGLFVGLLSQGERNPGIIIAEYLLTALDTIAEGGAEKNGAFFGKFISTLLAGISRGEDKEEEEIEEEDVPNVDSAAFIRSFLISLLGDLSKGSSAGSSKS